MLTNLVFCGVEFGASYHAARFERMYYRYYVIMQEVSRQSLETGKGRERQIRVIEYID
jgi:hypothetical protein